MEGYDMKLCRICLNTDTLYSMTPYSKAYEDLTGLQISNSDNLPPYLCSECAVKLLNSVCFKTTSLQAHSFLVDIISSHDHVNVQLIQSMKKEQNQLDLEGECDTDVEVGIKKENSDIEDIYQDVIEGGIDNDTIDQDIVTDGDAINSDVVPPDVKEEIVTSNSSEEVACYVIKSENEMKQETSNEDVGLEHENVVVPEDCSLEDPPAHPRLKSNTSTTGIEDLPQAEVLTHHNHTLEVDSGLQVNDKLSCDICPYQTNSDLLVPRHLKTHAASEHRCNEYSYCTADRRSLIRHLKIHSEEKQHSCSVCNRVFRRKCDLVVHLKTHSSQAYSCDVCQTKFSMKSMLAKHKRTHSGERPYICDFCNKAFHKSLLKEHLRTHSGERPYSCNVCHKSFSRSYHVSKHMRTHSDDRPYSCDICNKAFKLKSVLIEHLRTHSGERPYSCDICNKSFTQMANRATHMKTHSAEKPFLCTFCNKAFKLKGVLKEHLKTHSGERPYSCDICNKSFTQMAHRATHMKRHSAEKPFLCTICNKAFKLKGDLKVHLRTHSEN